MTDSGPATRKTSPHSFQIRTEKTITVSMKDVRASKMRENLRLKSNIHLIPNKPQEQNVPDTDTSEHQLQPSSRTWLQLRKKLKAMFFQL